MNFTYYSRRRALQLLGGLTGGLLLHACNNQTGNNTASSSSEQMTLKLAGNLWIGFTPLFIAQEKGFFSEENLTLDFFQFDSTADSTAAFLADQVEAVVMVSAEAVSAAAKEKDYRAVLVQDMSVGGDGILARNNIKSIQDFKGKQIAVERGTVSHFFLLQVLEEAGLSQADITLTNADPSAAAAAYQAGNVDIAVTYAPFMNQANKAQTDGRIIYDSSKMPTAIADIYAFSEQYVQQNPQAIKAFIRGIFKAIRFLENNPEEALAIAAPKFEIKPEALGSELEGLQLPKGETNIEMLGNPQSDLYLGKSLNQLAKFLVEQEQIKEAPEMNQVLEPQFVKSVMNS